MATNRLYRDTENAMLGGVCAGFAKRFDLDPTIVRAAVIGLAVITVGTTVLLYLALWIIMPAGPEADTRRPSKDELAEEFRGAGERVAEAGRIVSRAAKQAAGEISALQRRPTTSMTSAEEATTTPPDTSAAEPASTETPASEATATEKPGAPETPTPSGTAGGPFVTPPAPPAPPAGMQAPPPPPPPPPGSSDSPIPGPWGNDRPQQS